MVEIWLVSVQSFIQKTGERQKPVSQQTAKFDCELATVVSANLLQGR